MKVSSEELLTELKDKVACMALAGQDAFLMDNVWETLFLQPAELMWEWVGQRQLDIKVQHSTVQYLQAGKCFYEEHFEEAQD